MTRGETWEAIPDFPGYAISNKGRVMNIATELYKTPTPNQQGIYSVNLMRDGKQNRRSVSVLVARLFLDDPPRPTFDTPVNLDGDRSNNSVENLVWRPRWFAVKYHKQFLEPHNKWPYNLPIEIVSTGEKFRSTIECCVTYGLLARDVALAAHSGDAVPFAWLEVRVWKSDI